MFDKHDLIRIVRVNNNTFCVDHTGKFNGRGAYICKKEDCLKKSQKKRSFERSFKSKFVSCIYKDLTEIILESI